MKRLLLLSLIVSIFLFFSLKPVKAETDFEQLSLVSGGDESDFDKYFDKILKEELKNWTRLLLNSGYTETEVEFGANIDEVRDNYRFEIEEDGNIIVKKRTGFNS